MDNKNKVKLIRVATVSGALTTLLKGQLKFLSNHFEVKAVCSPDERFHLIKEQEGVESIPIVIKREISPWLDCLSLWKLFCLFRKEKPEIVHSHTPKAGLLSMLAAKMARVPIRVHTFTGIRFETTSGFFRKLLICMDKVTCWCATEIIPEGEGVKQTLLDNKITKKPLRKIWNGNINGVDTEYFHPEKVAQSSIDVLRAKLGIKESDFVFCFIGRHVKDKGIEELIQAFQQLSKQDQSVKLLLLGQFEPDLDPVDSYVAEIINNHPQIIHVGFQMDIRPYLSLSKVLVLPSYREGFPSVILQAGAMRLACIVTDINGCNEVIKSGSHGLIVKIKDSQGLNKAMQLLLDNKKICDELSVSLRERIMSDFRQIDVWDATLKFYKNVLNNKL